MSVRDEARQVLAQHMADLTHRSYDELVELLLNKPQTLEITGPSGARYQAERARASTQARMTSCTCSARSAPSGSLAQAPAEGSALHHGGLRIFE